MEKPFPSCLCGKKRNERRDRCAAVRITQPDGNLSLDHCQLSIIHCQLKIHLQFPSFPNWFEKIHHSQNNQGIKRKDQLVKRNKQPRTNPSDTIEKR